MKYILLALLLALPLSAFPQGEAEDVERARILNEYGSQDDQDQIAEDVRNPEDHEDKSNNKSDNKSDDLEASFANTVKDLQGLSPEEFSQEADKKNKGKVKNSFVSNMMNSMMKKMAAQFLKENPFSKMPKDEIKTMFTTRMSGLPVEKIINKYPVILDFVVEWLHDKRALPKLVGIINKPDDVKLYGLIVIGIFVGAFILNLMNSSGGLLTRIFKKLCIFGAGTVVNIGAFVYLFKTEIDPTIDVFLKFFHL